MENRKIQVQTFSLVILIFLLSGDNALTRHKLSVHRQTAPTRAAMFPFSARETWQLLTLRICQ